MLKTVHELQYDLGPIPLSEFVPTGTNKKAPTYTAVLKLKLTLGSETLMSELYFVNQYNALSLLDRKEAGIELDLFR